MKCTHAIGDWPTLAIPVLSHLELDLHFVFRKQKKMEFGVPIHEAGNETMIAQ